MATNLYGMLSGPSGARPSGIFANAGFRRDRWDSQKNVANQYNQQLQMFAEMAAQGNSARQSELQNKKKGQKKSNVPNLLGGSNDSQNLLAPLAEMFAGGASTLLGG